VVTLTPKQAIEMDIALSGRLDVRGEALLRTGLDAEAQVLAAYGLYTVKMPPTGDGRLVAMRLATPKLTLVLRPGTVAVVAVAKTQEVLVHVLSGQAEVAPAALTTEPVSESEKIGAGEAKRFDSEGVTSLKPGEDLAAALGKAEAFLKLASRSKTHAQADVASEHAAVEAVLAALDQETTRGRDLGVLQQSAIAAGDKVEQQSRQRELAQHGQRLFRIRRILLAVWERAQLAELRGPSENQAQMLQTHARLRARLVPVLPR
jgi:hypothetical protein